MSCPTSSEWRTGTTADAAARPHGAVEGRPLHVTRGQRSNPLTRAFVEAGRQAGYPVTLDYKRPPAGRLRRLRDDRLERRAMVFGQGLSATCASNRKLQGRTCPREPRHSQWNTGDRNRDRTCRTHRGDSCPCRGHSVRLVPEFSKLLMLSGIGPAAHLAEHGIETVADRPGVGQNLQDHLEIYVQVAASQPGEPLQVLESSWQSLCGPALAAHPQRTRRIEPVREHGIHPFCGRIEFPDLQFHFLPIAVGYDGRMAARQHGFQAHVGPDEKPLPRRGAAAVG